MNKFNYFNLIFLVVISLVSCETKNVLSENKNAALEKRNTLRINLNDNVLTQNPASIGTKSEKFIKYLMYEGLYTTNKHGKTVPTFINEHKIDSIRHLHLFKIKPKVAFHNGDILTTSHIYAQFKKLIDTKSNNKVIQSFQKSIVGFNEYTRKKKYKIGMDSLPSGLKIINSHSFSIEFIETQPEINYILSKPEFWIYQSYDERTYFGTGRYKLDYANEDISYVLTKHENYHSELNLGVDAINIRFIKNKKAEANEFLNGSLDLIINNLELQDFITETKYEKFNITKSSYTTLKTLSFFNMKNKDVINLFFMLIDSKTPKEVFSQLNINDSIEVLMYPQTYPIDSIYNLTHKLNLNDSSSKISLPIHVNCNADCTKTLSSLKNDVSKYFILNSMSYTDINPNAPYLVLEESKTHLYMEKVDLGFAKKVISENPYAYQNHFSFMILESKRELIYSNISLFGLSDYANWEKSLQGLYFVEPRILN